MGRDRQSYASPTGYGLGKSGWIRESYCNVAPKKLVKLVDPSAAPPEKPKKTKK